MCGFLEQRRTCVRLLNPVRVALSEKVRLDFILLSCLLHDSHCASVFQADLGRWISRRGKRQTLSIGLDPEWQICPPVVLDRRGRTIS